MTRAATCIAFRDSKDIIILTNNHYPFYREGLKENANAQTDKVEIKIHTE